MCLSFREVAVDYEARKEIRKARDRLRIVKLEKDKEQNHMNDMEQSTISHLDS